jgi:hypothetical protein
MQHNAHVDAYHDSRPVTFAKAATVHALIKHAADHARAEGIAQGMREKTSLDLPSDYDSRAAVYIVSAPSRRALSREIAKRNGRDDFNSAYDCTGRAFAWSCELLRAYRVGNEWHGVCVGRSYLDV